MALVGVGLWGLAGPVESVGRATLVLRAPATELPAAPAGGPPVPSPAPPSPPGTTGPPGVAPITRAVPAATASAGTPAAATPPTQELRVPAQVRVPAVGVDAPVVPVGVTGTELDIPDDVDVVGWWYAGAQPADPNGTVVLVGHVDDAEQGLGALAAVARAPLGSAVELDLGASRPTVHYRVTARERYPKSALPPELFTTTGPPRLLLITCGGEFDRRTRTYAENVVVSAAPTCPAVGGRADDGEPAPRGAPVRGQRPLGVLHPHGAAEEFVPVTPLIAERYRLDREPDRDAPAPLALPAVDELLDRRVDVVLLEPDPDDGHRRGQLRAAGRLLHVRAAAVVPVLDVGRLGDRPFLVVDAADAPLAERWDGRPLPPRDAARIALEVVDSVLALRAEGLTPLSLDPAQLRVRGDGPVRVVPQAGTVDPHPDPASDVRAVGALLDRLAPDLARTDPPLAALRDGALARGGERVADLSTLRAALVRWSSAPAPRGRDAPAAVPAGGVEGPSGGAPSGVGPSRRAGPPADAPPAPRSRGPEQPAGGEPAPGATPARPPYLRSVLVGLVAALLVLAVGLIVTLG